MSFEEFWELYNKKTGLKRCVAKWRLLSLVDKEGIKESLPNYIKNTPDPTYRKHPITYLNGESWKDSQVHEVKKEVTVKRLQSSPRFSVDPEGDAQIRRAYAQRKLEAPQNKIDSVLSLGARLKKNMGW